MIGASQVLSAPVLARRRPAVPVPQSLTWGAALLVSVAELAVAADSGRPQAFLASTLVTALAIVFAIRPLAGLLSVVLIHQSVDLWADGTLATLGGLKYNLSTGLTVLVVVVGGAHLLECWGTARRAPSLIPFVCLTAIAALSLTVAPSLTQAAPELVRLARIGVVYGLAFVLPRSRRHLMALVAVTLLSVLPVIGVALHQMAGSRGQLGGGVFQFRRATGGFAVADELGILLGLLLCFAVPLLLTMRLHHRLPMAIWAGLAGVALFGSYGRTGWIGLVAGLLVIGLARYRSLLVLVPVLVAIVALTVPSSVQRFADLNRPATSQTDRTDTLTERVSLWRENLPKLNQAPLLGLGLDAIAVQERRLVHSDFVRAAVELGLVGLAAYVWLLLSGLVGSVRALLATRRASLRRSDLLVAVSAGASGASVMFILASGDSNLITKPVLTGSLWLLIGVGHAAGRLAQAGR